MAAAAQAQLAGQDASSRLVTFMGELAEPLLPPRERYELLVLFSLLSGLALERPNGAHQRAALCSDGTPLEMSLSIDDRGEHALRFVCDVGAGIADGTDGRRQAFRGLADTVAPAFDGRRDALDRLFEMHLRAARAESRFQVWFGAGAAPGRPRTGMFYFNTEWLTPVEVLDILGPYIRPEDASALLDWAAACGTSFNGVAYDFGPGGMRKVKLYLRPGGNSGPETWLRHSPAGTGPRLLELLTLAFGAPKRRRREGFMLALGLPMKSSATQSSAMEASVYVHLESRGVRDFAGLTPILRRVLSDWDIDFDPGLSEGPRGCAPTLLSLTASGERKRLAVYFKPLLHEQPAVPIVADGFAAAQATC